MTEPVRRNRTRTGLFTGALLVAAIAVVVMATLFDGGTEADVGVLEVRSEPSVATQIRVGEFARNTSTLRGLPLDVGEYPVCFSAPEGYLAPPCEAVKIEADRTTTLTGTFVPAGRLIVETEPKPGPVLIDGLERDLAPLTIPIAEGSHEVCFGELAGYETPDCEAVEVTAGEDVHLTVEYGVRP